MVSTFLPTTLAALTLQDFVGCPSTWIVHAPHWATPQPYLVPVSPTVSRRTQSKGVSGSTSTWTSLPFMLRAKAILSPPFPVEPVHTTGVVKSQFVFGTILRMLHRIG